MDDKLLLHPATCGMLARTPTLQVCTFGSPMVQLLTIKVVPQSLI